MESLFNTTEYVVTNTKQIYYLPHIVDSIDGFLISIFYIKQNLSNLKKFECYSTLCLGLALRTGPNNTNLQLATFSNFLLSNSFELRGKSQTEPENAAGAVRTCISKAREWQIPPVICVRRATLFNFPTFYIPLVSNP